MRKFIIYKNTKEMYKTRGNKGLFDEEFTKERLSAMGNPLEAISSRTLGIV